MVAAALTGSYFAGMIGDTQSQAQVPTLREQLVYGLRARYPSDYAYIDQVVLFVNKGRLSREVVLGVFHWTRKKSTKKYLIPYFREGLRRVAREKGEEAP